MLLLLLLQMSACSLVGQQRSVVPASLTTRSGVSPTSYNELLYGRILQSPCDIVGLPIDFEADAEIRVIGNVRIDMGYARWPSVPVGDSISSMVADSGIHLSDMGELTLPTFLTPDISVVHALTGGPGWHNESHDCQRLVMPVIRRPMFRTQLPAQTPRRETAERPERERPLPSGRYFGPLVGIFPLHSAMALDAIEDTTLAVATIFNWGDRALEPLDYSRLGIEDGWSCLWLRAEDGVTQGAITSTTGPCAEAPPPAAATFTLQVRVSVWEPGNSLGELAYPHSARWGWDAPRSRHYVGIKCGTAWCSIGVATPPVEEVLTGPPHRAIPGWYDEQHLAVVSGEVLRPGPWTTIYPDSTYWMRMHDLNSFNASATHATIDMDMADADGMTVAHIVLADPAAGVGQYQQKFNLSAASPGNSTMRFAGNLPDQLVATFNMGTPAPRVTFVPSAMHSSPGAVRWRWQETDEKTWASCGGGCCTGGS